MRTDSPGPTVRRRALLALGVLAGLIWGLALGASPAGAAADDSQSNTIVGTLTDTSHDNAPVPDVKVTVTDASGKTYTDTSDESGKFEIKIPGDGGEVTIKLDESTLPEGAKLREGTSPTRTVTLTPDQTLPLLFPIGKDTRHVKTTADRVPQLIYNGLLFGIIIAMASLGLSMIFGTTGLTNFAHGELVTFGALIAYWGNVALHLPFFVATLMAVILGGLFGWAQDRGLWGPLRRRGTGLIAAMIISIGLQFLLRNLYQYFTGGRTLNYDDYVTSPGRDLFGLGLVTYSWRDVIVVLVSLVVLFAVIVALSRTRVGRATRAVADNPALASATGINVDQVISLVWIVGTALAALSGVFLGFQLGVTFQIGQVVLLLLFCAVIVGGLGSVWGALVGSLIVGLLIEVSTIVIPSELKNAGAMLLLIVILLVKPQGLFGRAERVG